MRIVVDSAGKVVNLKIELRVKMLQYLNVDCVHKPVFLSECNDFLSWCPLWPCVGLLASCEGSVS
jgi:hypothetical protein